MDARKVDEQEAMHARPVILYLLAALAAGVAALSCLMAGGAKMIGVAVVAGIIVLLFVWAIWGLAALASGIKGEE